MKVKVESTDRIGISQEILAIFASNKWNVKSIEVEVHFTFAHIENDDIDIESVRNSLAEVQGVINCEQIPQMPAEQRENHLHTLLNRIPDPLIDVDETGNILASNAAANALLENKGETLVNTKLERHIDLPFSHVLQENEISLSLHFLGRPFIADVNPVISNQKVSGAVISLKSMHKIGRQLSLMQSSPINALQSIIGKSEKINLIISQVQRFAELDLPVLISGDTGTGKEFDCQSSAPAEHQKGIAISYYKLCSFA